MNEKTLEIKARGYALKNAIAHEGKAIAGSVISALFVEGLKKEDMGKYGKKISEIVASVNRLSIEEQEKEFDSIKDELSERETREGLPELPNVKKSGVVMRFAPAPSGPLHIGNAISNVISYLYVKKYGGKFYVRIEDTDPERVSKDAYKMIKQDCNWMFENNVKGYIIQSKRLNIYYNYAEKLINKKSAYICTCNSEKFKNYVDRQENCPCRNLGVKENLERWKRMLDKSAKGYKEGDAVLRFKTLEGGMKNPNPAMRDFPLARISLHEHPLQKKKYKVWPLMNLSVTADDIEYGMTHIIRGKDHMDNAKRQKMIYEVLGLEKKYPWVGFMGRIKFTDMDLSKRKINEGIASGKFKGWDDEKLATWAALRKRGYKPEAFYKFSEQRGLSEVDKIMTSKDFFETLNQYNK